MESRRKLHLERLERLLGELPSLREQGGRSDALDIWRRRVSQSLQVLLGEDHPSYEAFESLNFREPRFVPFGETSFWSPEDQEVFERDLTRAESVLRDAIEEVHATEGTRRDVPAATTVTPGGPHPSRDELLSRLKDLEDTFTERKPDSVAPRELRRTIVAFANTVPEGRTAILFVGVGNEGEVAGVSNPDSKQKDIRKVCTDECAPPITVLQEVLVVERRAVVAVVVPHSSEVPHFTGAAYIRKGSESVRATEEELNQLFAMRNSIARAILHWKGKVVTVEVMGRQLGTSKALISSYRETVECEVEDCDQHTVTLKTIQTARSCAESLGVVRLSKDATRSRLKIIVDGR